jgi:uncharacterized protein YbjT (DUF2867 family)
MARVLIVGCDADALPLARELQERGHLVRGTARSRDELGPIEDAGAEAVEADPDRLGTLLPHLHGVSALCWLAGDSPRLEPLVETLVDTHVRGLVCPPGPGAEAARGVAATSNVGLEVVADPAEMAAALDRVLAI